MTERRFIQMTLWFGGAAFAGLLTGAFINARAESKCARNGYPEFRWTLPRTLYCVKRVEGTDTIISADSLR